MKIPYFSKRPQSVRSQATVELSFVIVIFIFLMLSMLDFAQFYFYRQSLNYAMREAGRFAATGAILDPTNYPASEYSWLSNLPIQSYVITNIYSIGTPSNPSATYTNLQTNYYYQSQFKTGVPMSRQESIKQVFCRYCLMPFTNYYQNITITSWPGTTNTSLYTNFPYWAYQYNRAGGIEGGGSIYTEGSETSPLPGPGIPSQLPAVTANEAAQYVRISATWNMTILSPGLYLGHGSSYYPVIVTSVFLNEPFTIDSYQSNYLTGWRNTRPDDLNH